MARMRLNRIFVITLTSLIVTSVSFSTELKERSLKELLIESGIKGGLIVYVGCGDGNDIATLRLNDSFIIHGLDANSNNVRVARKYMYDLGMSGSVSFARWNDLQRLLYAENLVNLLLVEDSGELTDTELRRVLVPNGIARVKLGPGQWRTIRKRWPAGMDGWSHWDHGADGNPVSRDELVGPPRQTQWIDGPSWSKKHWGPRLSAIVTSGGRLYYVQDETPTSLFNIEARWVLIARDAFNGVILWRRELPEWTGKDWGRVVRRGGEAPETGLVLGVWGELTGGSGVRDAMEVMVADNDRVYVPLSANAPLSAIDGATGKIVRTYEHIAPVQKVVLIDGTLLISGRRKVCAVGVETGQMLWETSGSLPCAYGKRGFAMDRKGTAIVAVRLETGEKLWETTFDQAFEATGGKSSSNGDAFTGPLQASAGILLVGSGDRRHVQTTALAAENGRPLWRSAIGDRPFNRGAGPFIIEGLVWSLDAVKGVLIARDPRTGCIEQDVAAPAIRYVGHHARCYLARATCRYIIGKERGADFIDLESGAVSWNNWLRGPCHRGVLPANGLLYAAQHSCRCYTEAALHGFHALAPKHQKTEDRDQKPEILEKGLAYNKIRETRDEGGRTNEWPTFRHDPMRSGATPSDFPDSPVVRWAKTLEGKLTAPVVVSGRIYIAAIDRHILYSFDAQSGEILWRYIAGGRIDTPPTIHQGLVLFGCRDGWIYCLRVTDGARVWRFRAVPEDRLIGAYGQLESAWPVHGSILIKDDVAYCVAGRSSYLDGGLRILALNPRTGELLRDKWFEGPWPDVEIGASPETPNRGFTSEGALPDVLVADADFIYLRHLRLDASLQKVEDMKPNVYVSPELTGENRGGDHKYWDNLIEAPRHALFTDPAWFHRSYFQNFPGRRLYATTGLIDDDGWHRRMYWSYGQVVGQYLVFRGPMGYAVQVFATSPREGGFNAGDGYVVYAGRTAEHEDKGKLFALRHDQALWRIRVPFRPMAMVLAGDQLVLAGPPDSSDPGQALVAIEGRRGGMLWVINAVNGRKSAEYQLETSPRYDGMAVAERRCYVSTIDGRLICLGDTARE